MQIRAGDTQQHTPLHHPIRLFSPTPPPPPEKGESTIVRCYLFLKRVFLRNKWQQQRTARERPLPISQNSATKHERGWGGRRREGNIHLFTIFLAHHTILHSLALPSSDPVNGLTTTTTTTTRT